MIKIKNQKFKKKKTLLNKQKEKEKKFSVLPHGLTPPHPNPITTTTKPLSHGHQPHFHVFQSN